MVICLADLSRLEKGLDMDSSWVLTIEKPDMTLP
jgi:hypothetical protein